MQKKTRVAEKISRTNREDSGHPEYSCQTACKRIKPKEFPEVWQDNAENTDKQKFLLFNYLTAQGISPEEARVQIENLLFENTQNNTLNE